MKHSRLQKFLFYSFLKKYFDNDFLDRLIYKEKDQIPYREQRFVLNKLRDTNLELEENEAKVMGLMYALHMKTKDNTYLTSFIEEMIQEAEMNFEEDHIKGLNDKLTRILEQLGLPKIEIEAQFLLNMGRYLDDFYKKYDNFKLVPEDS